MIWTHQTAEQVCFNMGQSSINSQTWTPQVSRRESPVWLRAIAWCDVWRRTSITSDLHDTRLLKFKPPQKTNATTSLVASDSSRPISSEFLVYDLVGPMAWVRTNHLCQLANCHLRVWNEWSHSSTKHSSSLPLVHWHAFGENRKTDIRCV